VTEQTDGSELLARGRGTLVVLLHAYARGAADLAAVEGAVRATWPEAEIYCPDFPATIFSLADPNDIVAGLIEGIDRVVEGAEHRNAPITDIVLVGHSLGALLARKLYVVACGETPEAPFEPAYRALAERTRRPLDAPRSWAGRVSRIVLLAGMNRGWRISHHLSLGHAPLWWIGAGIGHLIHLFSGRWPLIFSIRRGAEFITELRIQWLFMRRRAAEIGAGAAQDGTAPPKPGMALTVQLLGSRDDMVAPEDNVDLVSGGDFVYLDVPHSGHADVIEMDDPQFGEGRKRVFLRALAESSEALQREAVIPSDERFAEPDPNIRKVVFVIHGIRDEGYWTHKIARRVKERAGDDRAEWATETSSYGYFPMLPFLFPWYRRRKVEWLMDQYAEALARYPNAAFSYVGHSNGTYLLAKALELYPCCRFEHVVFAGSVVHRRYDWQRLQRSTPPQVRAVLNFVASRDWVVAFFAKFFQSLGLQDLGSAGHDGFAVEEPVPGLYQVEYLAGGHGTGVREAVWDFIAEFVVTGRVNLQAIPGRVGERSEVIALLGLFPPLVWLVILALAGCLWLGITSLIGVLTPNDPWLNGFSTGVAAALYLSLLWLVLTRV